MSYSSAGSPTQSLSLASPDLSSTQANTHATQAASSVPATPTKPRGRRKKAGSNSYAEFLLADLEWYKSKDKDKDKSDPASSAPEHGANVDVATPSTQPSSALLPGQSASSSTDRPGPSTQLDVNSPASSKQLEAAPVGSSAHPPRIPGANEQPQAVTGAIDGTPSISSQPPATRGAIGVSSSDPSENAINNEEGNLSSSNTVIPPSSTQPDENLSTRVVPISTSESVSSTAAPPPSTTPDHETSEPSRTPGHSNSESMVVQVPSSREQESSHMDVDDPENVPKVGNVSSSRSGSELENSANTNLQQSYQGESGGDALTSLQSTSDAAVNSF
jgi:hypothetical protein